MTGTERKSEEQPSKHTHTHTRGVSSSDDSSRRQIREAELLPWRAWLTERRIHKSRCSEIEVSGPHTVDASQPAMWVAEAPVCGCRRARAPRREQDGVGHGNRARVRIGARGFLTMPSSGCRYTWARSPGEPGTCCRVPTTANQPEPNTVDANCARRRRSPPAPEQLESQKPSRDPETGRQQTAARARRSARARAPPGVRPNKPPEHAAAEDRCGVHGAGRRRVCVAAGRARGQREARKTLEPPRRAWW